MLCKTTLHLVKLSAVVVDTPDAVLMDMESTKFIMTVADEKEMVKKLAMLMELENSALLPLKKDLDASMSTSSTLVYGCD